MIATEPDLVVGYCEAHDVVDEWFGFAGGFWDAENVGEELLDEDEVRFGVEGGVKGEDGTGAFEAVAREMKF